MSKIIIAVLFIFALSGCNSDRREPASNNTKYLSKIECYSGGQIIYKGEGDVWMFDSYMIIHHEDGSKTVLFGDCVVRGYN